MTRPTRGADDCCHLAELEELDDRRSLQGRVQAGEGRAGARGDGGRDRAPSRALAGVVSFDIGRDLTNPNAFIATEVFEDREALDRQESQPQVERVLALLGDSLVAEPEATIFEVSSSEPHGG